MIVLEHDHTREVMTMGIDPANKHAIFLNKSEPRCRLSCASNCASETVAPS